MDDTIKEYIYELASISADIDKVTFLMRKYYSENMTLKELYDTICSNKNFFEKKLEELIKK